MATKTVVTCDRCGHEETEWPSWKVTCAKNTTVSVDKLTVDLCVRCVDGLVRYLKNKDTK